MGPDHLSRHLDREAGRTGRDLTLVPCITSTLQMKGDLPGLPRDRDLHPRPPRRHVKNKDGKCPTHGAETPGDDRGGAMPVGFEYGGGTRNPPKQRVRCLKDPVQSNESLFRIDLENLEPAEKALEEADVLIEREEG